MNKKFFTLSQQKGFTLIELLVVISIIAILSAVGLVSYNGIRTKAQDAKIKSDINAIAKAYEQKFDPSAGGGQGAYKTISTNDFAGGAIPTGTSDKTYGGFTTTDAKGFRVCSPLMSNPATTCNVESPTCYCKASTQGAGSNFGYTPGGASGGDFGYRVPVSINNGSGSTLSDFQVQVTSFNTQSLITSNPPKMKSDCSDLRVADSNGVAIPYWIESGCNSSNTLVWVKPASLATGDNTIYFYYGNTTATDAADANAVFDLYDDFNGSTINLSKWTIGTCRENNNPVVCNIIPTQSGGKLNITGTAIGLQQNSIYGVTSVRAFSNFIVETRFNTVTPSNEYKASVGTSFDLAGLKRTGGTLEVKYYGGNQWNRLFASGYGSSGYTVFTEKVQPNRIDWFENNIFKGFRTISPALGDRNIVLFAGPDIKDVPFDAKYDWVRVRKYASSDPIASIDSEQTP